MSISISVEPRGFVKSRRLLDKLTYFDTRDLLDNIGADVERQVRSRIEDQEGPPGGGQWEEYIKDDSGVSRYEKWKKKRSSGGFLELYGELRDSITHNIIGNDSVEIGPSVDREHGEKGYPSVMQFGRKDGSIPARPYLGLSSDNEDKVEEAVDIWIRKVLRR